MGKDKIENIMLTLSCKALVTSIACSLVRAPGTMMEDVTADVGSEVLSEEGAAVEETDESEEDGEDGEEGEEIEAGSPPQPPRASAAARNSAETTPAIGVRFIKFFPLSRKLGLHKYHILFFNIRQYELQN